MSDLPYWRVPIREGCYLVGHRDPDSLLHCNTYLRSPEPGIQLEGLVDERPLRLEGIDASEFKCLVKAIIHR